MNIYTKFLLLLNRVISQVSGSLLLDSNSNPLQDSEGNFLEV